MDTVFFMLTFCLSLAFTAETTGNGQKNLHNTSTQTSRDVLVNSTKAPSLNSSEHLTISTTVITSTSSVVEDNDTSTVRNLATTATSNPSTTLESTTLEVASTSGATQSTDVTTSVPHTGHSTTVCHQTTKSATVTTTTNSSVVNATSQSVHATQGVRLSQSDKNLTITFSVVLGIFALAVVAVKLHRCSHKLQFLHQPLNNGEDLNVSTADPDTLIISGGPYDGHPIYDNVPPATQDESQFRLDFLH